MSNRINGVRYAILVYLHSDKLDAGACLQMTLKVPPPPIIVAEINAKELATMLGLDIAPLLAQADDWRTMTDEEITEFREDHE